MTKVKSLFLACFAFFLGLSISAQAYTISINQYVEHPSLNAAVEGFKDQLKANNIEVTYHEHNAQAKNSTVTQIVNLMIDEKPDLILAVATPSAQQTAQKIKDIPILFTAVTDPVNAGLVPSLAAPDANITGTTDMNPVALQLALIKEIQPTAKNIGFIYNAGEANSVVQRDMARDAAVNLGFNLVEATADSTANVNSAAQSLIGRVDAIYLPTDNTVIASLEPIIKVSLEHKIPIYPAEDDSIRKAGLATYSISYYGLGQQTGRMATKILVDNISPRDIPVEDQTDHKLIVNLGYAQQVGIDIPQSVLDKAQEILQ
ncbi:MAG: ABC transporter substrate-binding protein [Deltaproteobacteria bacterium]|jgi:putative ABC transport system substrate-binding protein|nr:ABC transporter substrate-binding protein [Deltaproteobacteria bacterium]